MAANVDALLPLSFLEAVRAVDTPEGDIETEYVPELRNKRLGLSDTVYAQIKRYTDAKKQKQRTSYDEAVALARLIGRRPDAEAIFRSAGRYLAKEAYLTVAAARRRAMLALPALAARPLAFGHARRIAQRYLNGSVTRVGSSLLLDVPEPVTADSAPGDTGCAYYESALHELVHLLVDAGGPVEHVRCVNRGEASSQWRADWTT